MIDTTVRDVPWDDELPSDPYAGLTGEEMASIREMKKDVIEMARNAGMLNSLVGSCSGSLFPQASSAYLALKTTSTSHLHSANILIGLKLVRASALFSWSIRLISCQRLHVHLTLAGCLYQQFLRIGEHYI